jgi:hypothetical protein
LEAAAWQLGPGCRVVSKTSVSETIETSTRPPASVPANAGPTVLKVISLPIVSYLVACNGF